MLLYQDNDSYCYNSDTHFLYHFICESLKDFKNIQGKLLDVGSGCGILGLLLARDYPKMKLYQVEIYPKMQFLSQKNSEINKINATLYAEDFLECSFAQKFDMIVSNPPFYHAGALQSHNDHLQKARYNTSLPLEPLIQKMASLLTHNGKFAFCYDVKQIADIIATLKKYKLGVEKICFVHPKKEKNSSLVMLFGRNNSRSLCTVLPPLIAFDGAVYSHDADAIYKKSATHSIKVEL